METLGGGETIDFKALVDDPGLLAPSANSSIVTRFIAGNFTFAAANRDLIATLMLPIVHVRSSEIAASRLRTLLATLGDEALSDRPGRSLVLDRLLEVILIEALRYPPADMEIAERGLMAGLADTRIGRALRIMHSDAKRPWTLATLAREVGMSRSAFTSRFMQLVGIPPIEYLANWRMTLAKSALASDLPMADIAEIAGFQSVSAFSTAFKRQTGFSPSVYARSLQHTV